MKKLSIKGESANADCKKLKKEEEEEDPNTIRSSYF